MVELEQNRSLLMEGVQDDVRQNQGLGVTLEVLKNYLNEQRIREFGEYSKLENKIINFDKKVRYRSSDIYGVFLADNSFSFCYEEARGEGIVLMKCTDFSCISANLIPVGYKGLFKSINGSDACVMNIWELIPTDKLLADFYVNAESLVIWENKINYFMQNNPSLIENVLKKRINIRDEFLMAKYTKKRVR